MADVPPEPTPRWEPLFNCWNDEDARTGRYCAEDGHTLSDECCVVCGGSGEWIGSFVHSVWPCGPCDGSGNG